MEGKLGVCWLFLPWPVVKEKEEEGLELENEERERERGGVAK